MEENKNIFRLESLEIQNFRCFEQYRIDRFGNEVTILIGKNGAGKSTLIHAIRKAMSFIFKKDSKEKADRTLTSGVPTLKVEPFSKYLDLKRDYTTGLAFPYINIKAQGLFCTQTLNWEMYASTSTFSIQHSKYVNAFSTFMDIVEMENKWPVLAYFSDGFPHISANKVDTNKRLLSLRNFGYYQWNEKSACSSVWIEKFSKALREWERCDRKIHTLKSRIPLPDSAFLQQQIEQAKDTTTLIAEIAKTKIEIQKWDDEVKAIKDCFRVFTMNDDELLVKDFSISINEDELCVETENGDNILFRNLSAGYKRLLSIVLEVACRSYILNSTTQSSGIVIIDEIDLHLHPSLEQNVIERLKRTFPNIQFIITTHSPLIIANIKQDENNKVIVMTKENEIYSNEELNDVYGIGYDMVVSQIMKTPARSSTIEYLVDSYIRLIRRGKEEKATETLEVLKTELGTSYERVKLEIDNRLAL